MLCLPEADDSPQNDELGEQSESGTEDALAPCIYLLYGLELPKHNQKLPKGKAQWVDTALVRFGIPVLHLSRHCASACMPSKCRECDACPKNLGGLIVHVPIPYTWNWNIFACKDDLL